mmetsp:Transcript_19225/g.41852  ORF Transcript_19225/g.41852 Transcript_19225/m.41852 type:complete len:201 (+) Transcript_19225:230-832(+)
MNRATSIFAILPPHRILARNLQVIPSRFRDVLADAHPAGRSSNPRSFRAYASSMAFRSIPGHSHERLEETRHENLLAGCGQDRSPLIPTDEMVTTRSTPASSIAAITRRFPSRATRPLLPGVRDASIPAVECPRQLTTAEESLPGSARSDPVDRPLPRVDISTISSLDAFRGSSNGLECVLRDGSPESQFFSFSFSRGTP